MKAIAAFVAALAAVACALPNPIYREWEEWKQKFQPQYASNGEEQQRLRNFARNKRIALELNKQFANDPDGPRFGMTQFADMSPEEFASIYLHEIPSDIPRDNWLPATNKKLSDFPATKNWVEEGAVTRVKNQGSCGSCWAFSATGNMEGVYKVEKGVLPSLSEQQLVDCDHECREYKGQKVCDSGCNGGLMSNALAYAMRNGMVSEAEYPYRGKAGTCNMTGKGNYTFFGWAAINNTEEEIVAALNLFGPLSVGVNANMWQLYMGGIFNLPCSRSLNHGVLLVGYGTQGKKDYWLIKNSWGTGWGEKGYIRMVRHKNKCGINDFVNTIVILY